MKHKVMHDNSTAFQRRATRPTKGIGQLHEHLASRKNPYPCIFLGIQTSFSALRKGAWRSWTGIISCFPAHKE